MVTAVEKAKGDGDEAEQKLLERKNLEIVPGDDTNKINEKSRNNEKQMVIPDDKGSANGTFSIGPAAERDYELVPPDGNFGWVVLAVATLSNILISGSIKSSGVLLVEFREMFEASQAESSTMVALCYFLYSCLGPVASIMCAQWSYRTVVLLGTTIGATGMILSSFATSIYYLYVSFGMMLGIGAGFSVPAAIYIVTTYFVKFRGLANGICVSGSVFGSMLLPPLIRYLVETYGCKGAVLIQGGIMLNAVAGGLLFHPVEKHMIKKYKDPEDADDPLLNEEKVETKDHTLPIIKTDEKIDKEKTHLTRELSEKGQNDPNDHNNLSALYEKRRNSTTRRSSQYINDRKLSHEGPRRTGSISSFTHMSTSFCGSELINTEETEAHQCVASTDKESKETTCCFCFKKMKKEKKEKSKKFDIAILKDPLFLIILASGCVIPISYTNFMILLPTHVQNIGFSKGKGAYLLSIVCGLELAGRLGGSAICDLRLVSPTIYYAVGLLFAGITQAIVPFLDSYLPLSIVCGLFGLCTGITCGAQTIVMTETLGIEKLMSSYGITVFFSGILQLVGPPICGLWFEHDKNFFNMFVTFGIIYIIGSALWLFVPLLNKQKAQPETKIETPQKV